ncbi:glycosyltransferase [Photobacterium damselae]|uniref:glycosyltransferase n=1 Tax=Photobacterium damselae TaxID=38293 RepID=UPI0035A82B06
MIDYTNLPKVAIAMSIYKNDKVKFVTQSIESLLNQTYLNRHIFIEVDGDISYELRTLLEKYNELNNIDVSFNQQCKGLAYRLNNIISYINNDSTFDFMARMDADDISHPQRIEKQVNFMLENPNVSVIGSDVIEIDVQDRDIFYKKMESSHEKIKENIIKKCPFNHPTVMFRVSVLKYYRYDSKLLNTQDYYLWVDLLKAGYVFSNINEPLLKFRVDDDFHTRRGFKKAINDTKSRIYAVKVLNNISLSNINHIVLLFLLRISPSFLKKLAYKKFRN